MFQRGKNILRRQRRRLFFRYDVDIPVPCDLVLVQPKKLTAQPFDPVADNGVSDLLRYGNPQARPLPAPRADAHQKIPAVKNVLRTRQPKELGAFQYPVVFGEKKSQPCPYSLGRSTPDAGLPAIRFQPSCTPQLCGEPLSPLGPAPFDDVSARLGGHPLQKAMGSFPLDLAGLIRSFHNRHLFSIE